jgi:transposase-like protein
MQQDGSNKELDMPNDKNEQPAAPNQSPAGPNKFLVKKPTLKVGQPSKYDTRRANTVLKALRAGLTKAQACLACGISRQTLATWCEKYPEFGLRVDAAREKARQDALEDIKDAGKEDWKATAQWLRLAFPEYRTEQRHTVQLNSQTNILCDEETRMQIVEMRKKIMERQENRERLTSGTNGQVIEAEVLEGRANEKD